MRENITDNEFQLLGSSSQRQQSQQQYPKQPNRVVIGLVSAIILLVLGVLIWWPVRSATSTDDDEPGLFEQTSKPSTKLLDMITPFDSVTIKGCAVLTLTQNDIPLRVFYPRNARAAVGVGVQHLADTANILTFQAADIRADNQKIVGAFVEHGKPLSWGLSKKGYCGMIGDSITVGVADNSPLFEQACATGGSFFRQYPLVDNGTICPTELKTQTVRRGLCDVAGRIVVVESLDKVSFHDFAEVLVDLGISNAIYLVGGEARGRARDLQGNLIEIGAMPEKPYKYINFVYWQ